MHDSPPILTCRTPARREFVWIFVLFGVALLVAACFAAPPINLACLAFAAFCQVLALLVGALDFCLRSTVMANDWGLKQRYLGRTVSIAWEAVTDYFEELSLSQRDGRWALVVEGSGKSIRLSPRWSNSDAFRQLVSERATNARARDWGRLGYRDLDERPQEFAYMEEVPRAMIWVCWVFAAVMCLWSGWTVVVRGPGIVRDMGWPLGLSFLALIVCIYNSVGMVALLFQSLSRKQSRRKNQRIEATVTGLRFRDDGQDISIRWDEIVSHGMEVVPGRVESYRYIVRSRPAEFDYSSRLKRAWLLRRLLEQYAPPQTRRDADRSDLIGGPSAGWSSGVVGVGERIFTYRTRTNRAVLAFVAAHGLAPLTAQVLRGGFSPSPSTWVGYLPFLLLLVYLFWRYRSGGIRLDHQGLTEHSVRGDIRILWSDVECYDPETEKRSLFAWVKGGGRKLGFCLGIADASVLMREIATRSTHATTRGWTADLSDSTKGSPARS